MMGLGFARLGCFFAALLTIASAWPTRAHADEISSDCAKSIAEELLGPTHTEAAQKFLKLQGELTLHKLAWAGLQDGQTAEKFKIEKVILDKLDQLNGDDSFKEAREKFR